MLNALKAQVTHLSLHDGYPASDANEISGGSYARQSVTWGNSSNGVVNATNQPVFNVPANTTIAAVGLRSAVTGGELYGSSEVTPETFTHPGTFRLENVSMDLNK